MNPWSEMQGTSKPDADRALYSQQNRQALLKRAGIDYDPVKQTYDDYLNARYEGVPKTVLSPKSPLLGYMEADRLGVDPTTKLNKGSFMKAATKKFDFHPSASDAAVNFEDTYVPDGYALNLAGETVWKDKQRANPQITVYGDRNKSVTMPRALSTLAHEFQHVEDVKGGHQSAQVGTWGQSRKNYKAGHHNGYSDFEVEKPLLDLLRSALISGESVNTDLVNRYTDSSTENRNNGISSALERRPQGVSPWTKMKVLLNTGGEI